MADFWLDTEASWLSVDRVMILDRDDYNFCVLDIRIKDFPSFCGGKIIHAFNRYSSGYTSAQMNRAEKMLFAELKNIDVAKLVWADMVDGEIHTMITKHYPDSEVGTPKKNPNSDNMVLVGELNIEDM